MLAVKTFNTVPAKTVFQITSKGCGRSLNTWLNSSHNRKIYCCPLMALSQLRDTFVHQSSWKLYYNSFMLLWLIKLVAESHIRYLFLLVWKQTERIARRKSGRMQQRQWLAPNINNQNQKCFEASKRKKTKHQTTFFLVLEQEKIYTNSGGLLWPHRCMSNAAASVGLA